MLTAHDSCLSDARKEGYHEEPLVPEGADDVLGVIPELLRLLREKHFFAGCQGECIEGKKIDGEMITRRILSFQVNGSTPA